MSKFFQWRKEKKTPSFFNYFSKKSKLSEMIEKLYIFVDKKRFFNESVLENYFSKTFLTFSIFIMVFLILEKVNFYFKKVKFLNLF